MTKCSLPKNFFEDNPLGKMSPAQLTHFQMVTVTMPGFNEEIAGLVVPRMDTYRRGAYEIEKDRILKCDTTEEVVKYMRKNGDYAFWHIHPM